MVLIPSSDWFIGSNEKLLHFLAVGGLSDLRVLVLRIL